MSIRNNISRQDAERLDRYVKETSKGLSHIDRELEKDLISVYINNPKEREKEKALSLLVSYNITIFADIAINVLNNIRGGDRIDPLDLMQVAVSTFIKKIHTFDTTKKTKMITYYYRDVKTQMQRYVMANAFSVKQGSVFLQHLAFTISQYKASYIQEYNTEPSVHTMSKELKVSENTINLCIKTTNVHIMSSDESFDLYVSKAYPDNYSPVEQIIKTTLQRYHLNQADYEAVLDCFEGRELKFPPKILELIN